MDLAREKSLENVFKLTQILREEVRIAERLVGTAGDQVRGPEVLLGLGEGLLH